MYRFTVLFAFVMCERVVALSIDQRQTGDLNVQIDLKNFNVFALTKGKEEYVDYDYAYDYSEMTIKPQNGTSTTIKPTNTTEIAQIDKNNATTPAVVALSINIVETNGSIDDNVTTDSPMSISVSSSTAATTTVRLEIPADAVTATDNQTSAILDCKKGFFRNNKGNCELKLQNPSNILLKMLQQKSKSSGGNGVRKS